MTKHLWRTVTCNTLWRGTLLASVFFLNLAVARVFGAGPSGRFLFLVTNFQLASALAGLGLDSGIQYLGASEPGGKRELAGFVVRYAAAAALLTALVAGVLLLLHVFDSGWMVAYAVGFVGGSLFLRFNAALANSGRLFQLPVAVEACGNLILIALLLALRDKQHLFFGVYFAMPLVCGGVVRAYLPLEPGPKTQPSLRRLWRYSAQAFAANLVFFAVYRVDYWWVAAYCSAGELGNYIQAAKLAQLFFFLPQVIAMVIFPDIVQGVGGIHPGTIRRLMRQIAGLYVLILVPFLFYGRALLACVLGPGTGFGSTSTEGCWRSA